MLILIGVRNGERFLGPQLDSLRTSGVASWTLWASDDGSSDGSLAMIQRFASTLEDGPCSVVTRHGPQQGFAANYLSMLADLPDVPGHVALADQDDIWLPKRLGRAVRMLNRLPSTVPAFVYGRRFDWGPKPGRMRPSRLPRGRACFANALVENVAFGNTLVLNGAAARIARQAAPLANGIYSHDWWLYQLLTGAGAISLMDREPSVLYRQHEGNAIGAQGSLADWTRRKIGVARGLYAERVQAQLNALQSCSAFLTPENQEILSLFISARQAPWPRRVREMRRAGIFRQSLDGTVGFWGAVLLGRI
ncbi:glycosyltransferase [Pseudooceanicola sediminis]|nr:glycosyltransferase [Pseudooceanicola sediminis]|tara:strand:+ start:11717 stop:12637 length:921 start_codon:yes stop_codon:yes gene_type:complete